jgi:hypothetical protein
VPVVGISSSHHSYGPLTLGQPGQLLGGAILLEAPQPCRYSPQAPAFLGWAQRTSGTGAYQLPALTVDSSTGLVIEAFGLDLHHRWHGPDVDGDDSHEWRLGSGSDYRFAILAETAF